MNYYKKSAIRGISTGIVLGLLSFVFISHANSETIIGAWNGLAGGVLFIFSAFQVAGGISFINKI